MWTWMSEHQAAVWFLGGLLLIAADMLIGLELWLLMFGAGALAGAVAALLGATGPVALAVAAACSLMLMLVVRPPVLKRLHGGSEFRLEPTRELIGRHTRAFGSIDDERGQIRLDGVVWTARPYVERTVIADGTAVEVLEVDGVVALVHPIDESIAELDDLGTLR